MRLLVGRIGRAHGILGEATIEVRTDDPDIRFAIGATVSTDKHGDLTVVSGRVHNGILLLGFKGITTRNQIEELRNEMLYSDVDINESTGDDDQYHVLQLIGCMTYLESGDQYGEVSDVINLPGQDLLAIQTEQGESLIPFVHQLVPEVDVKNKRIVVIPLNPKSRIPLWTRPETIVRSPCLSVFTVAPIAKRVSGSSVRTSIVASPRIP